MVGNEGHDPAFVTDIREIREDTLQGVEAVIYLAHVVVNDLLVLPRPRGNPPLRGDGGFWRPLLHAESRFQAVLGAVGSPGGFVKKQSFNLVRSGENHHILERAKSVAGAVRGYSLLLAEGGGPDRQNYRVDGSRLAFLLLC